jgi:hypothetical protein
VAESLAGELSTDHAVAALHSDIDKSLASF